MIPTTTSRDSQGRPALRHRLLRQPHGCEGLASVAMAAGGVWAFQGSCAGSLARLAAVTGRFEVAARHFEEAIAINEKTGARPWPAGARFSYAELLLARSDPSTREQALDLLDRSLQAAREIGMRDLVQRAESLRAQAPAG